MKSILERYSPLREGEGTGGGGGDKPWTEGLAPELLGHVQNRQWDKLTPAEAAQAAVKAHKEAEGFIGVPADRVLKLPTDAADKDGWNAVYTRLGRPADPKDYDFSTVKGADGKDLEPAFAEFLRKTAFENNLSKERAIDYAKSVIGFRDASNAEALNAQKLKVDAEAAELKTNWASNFDANMVIAKAGAAKLGITPEAVAALEGQIGYKNLMETFLKIGIAGGEANFLKPLGGGGDGLILSVDAAKDKLGSLQKDKDWTRRFLAGGSTEKAEFDKLTKIIAGVA